MARIRKAKDELDQADMMKMMPMMGMNPMMMMMMMGGGMGGGMGGMGVRKGMFDKGSKTFKTDDSGGVLGEFTGTIKSGGRAYGFIECPEAGKGDIFVHHEERKEYKRGQTVKFTLVLNKSGKPQAINLKSGLKC